MTNKLQGIIPSCITLTEEQKFKLLCFVEYIQSRVRVENLHMDEDVSMASPFIWKIFETGIATIINVSCLDKECSLTIHDDGTLEQESWI